jgi:hypothetical protein
LDSDTVGFGVDELDESLYLHVSLGFLDKLFYITPKVSIMELSLQRVLNFGLHCQDLDWYVLFRNQHIG